MKLIVFDCDGTIVDSQHVIVAAMDRAFEAHALTPPTRDAVLSIVGLSLGEAIARLMPPDEHDAVGRIAESYKAAFAEMRADPLHHEPLFTDARRIIAALSDREDILLGIATGKSRRGVDALFEREALASHFMTIQTADDHPSKPHPSMLERAMAEAGVEPDRTVMIGDTTFDMEMARAARVGRIGVSWGYHDAPALLEVGVDRLVDTFAELPDALDAHFVSPEAAA